MADSISSFTGLASGIQWRDLVDQIMTIETQRRLDPVTNQASAKQKAVDAWSKYTSLVTTFRDAASKLRDGTAFGAFTVNAANSAATGRALLTATASSSAAPGSYNVEVLDLARANKLSGNIVASSATALGLTGDFAVNGKKVSVIANDTLSVIRDKINAVNTGTSPSGVTATILSTGSTQQRLVLTSDSLGAAGVELVDDASGTLQSLGLVDNTKSLNLSATGGAQTYHVSSSTAAIATMMGVTMPPPSTITIGGKTVSVDLTIDSLATIAAKIQAAGGTASVTSESVGGKTAYQLVADGTAAASTPDGLRTLDILGFMKNGRSSITQVATSQNTFQDSVGGTAAGATLLTDMSVAGSALGIAVGDTFNISGTRGDGTTVSTSLTVGASDDINTLLAKINDATSGFGAGTRTATATLSNGQIVLTDSKGGDSQLALSLSVTQSGGGTLSLGRVTTSTVGRQRELVAGTNAQVSVDGVFLSRSTNAISDAIAGVTLNLQQAEVGTTVQLDVTRDKDTIGKSMNAVATAYNDLLTFVADQKKVGAALHNDATLRASFTTFTSSLLASVVGTTGAYTQAGVAGLSLQKDGKLSLDSTVFNAALATNFTDISRLFSSGGSSANSDLTYVLATTASKPGTYAVNITAAATTPTKAGTGFSGTYADDATADTLTITDAVSGANGSISLANGDTTDSIVDKLNALFGNNRMALTASKSGNDLVITGTRYGSGATFTVAYTAGGTDGTAQLGLAAGTYAGTDVAGTIGGFAATGSGQLLTAAAGNAPEGLALSYIGTATGNVGDFTYISGVGGALYAATDVLVRTGGTIPNQTDSLTASITTLSQRADTVQQGLDRRRQSLVKQFVQMEAALSRLQSQSNALTSFVSGLQSSR